ncbi:MULTISPECIES: hypothetical protein [Mesorhizobium]|uniref:hypothetical protein n=1 Tax=Mesorhizobium TaxID=68287 RepID=UPI001459FE45|nr:MULTISPECIES: hypothetical protein [Mesorhizobium]
MTQKIGIDFLKGSCANQTATASFARPKNGGAAGDANKKARREAGLDGQEFRWIRRGCH